MKRLFLLALLLACTAHASDTGGPDRGLQKVLPKYRDAMQLLLTGHYQQSMRLFEDMAQKNDPAAQNILGLYYEWVQVPSVDYAKAEYWYRRSADQGSPNGELLLGLLIENGHAKHKDADEAVALYRQAADYGLPDGQYHLGLAYEKGYGVAQDYAAAADWYRKATGQLKPIDNVAALIPPDFYGEDAFGHAVEVAAYRLGLMYEYGRGVPVDLKQAQSWYFLATRQNLAIAELKLGQMREAADHSAKAAEQAKYWYEMAAKHGLKIGEIKLAAAERQPAPTCTASNAALDDIRHDLPLKPGRWAIKWTWQRDAVNLQAAEKTDCSYNTTVCIEAGPTAGAWPQPADMEHYASLASAKGTPYKTVTENDESSDVTLQKTAPDISVRVQRQKASDSEFSYRSSVHYDASWMPQHATNSWHTDTQASAQYVGACTQATGS